jgi:hypothetical protein
VVGGQEDLILEVTSHLAARQKQAGEAKPR